MNKLGDFHAKQTCRETGLRPPVKYFTDRSKAALPLWIICVIFVVCLSVHCCLVVILLVMFNCVLSLSHVVSLVRCGT